MASVQDVAAAIVKKLAPVSALKLQKLLYYCQGWHLAWDGVPLFRADIEAWANGPVVPAVYKHHRGQFTLRSWPTGDPKRLAKNELETVEAVVDAYGKWTPRQLVVKTHGELPWRNARKGLPDGAPSHRKIALDDLADYFGGFVG